MNTVFETFADLLDRRFGTAIPTTEDSVRYTFFAALLQVGVRPEEVVLEYPHPSIRSAEVDTWLPHYVSGAVGLEFKYHRDPPGGKNQPKTMKAGDVYADIRRLAMLRETTAATCYFVYVTTREMAVYFQNPRNDCHDMFNLTSTIEIKPEWFSSRPSTFTKAVGEPFGARITGVFSRDIGADYFIRIVQVDGISDT